MGSQAPSLNTLRVRWRGRERGGARWGVKGGVGGTDVKGARDLGGRPGEGSWRELRALQVKEGIPQRESISAMTVSEEGGLLGVGDWTLGVGGRERPSGSGARRKP